MEKVNISGVPETMLQTVYARSVHSKKTEHKFYDKKAVEIVAQLDYDFSNAEKDAAMSNGVIARTILLDRMVGDFINRNPNATIVNIACGLDTRFYRVDNGKIHWYNIDLPETIDLRRKFLDEDGRVSMISCSAMNEKWADKIENPKDKTLVIIEGLTMYLNENDVHQILSIIDRRFKNVEIIMETMNPFVVKHIKEKSIKATKAKFTWGLKSGKDLKTIAPNFNWVKDISLTDGMKELYPIYKFLSLLSPIRNMANKLVVLRK